MVSGLSDQSDVTFASQEQACVTFAEQAGWRTAATIRDPASGYTLDRPGIERLRALVREGGADVVLAYAVDRLSRNQNQIGVLFDELQTGGVTLECVTERFEDSAVGRFILAARAFVAEVEREKIVERTTRGKTERAKSGRIPQGNGKGLYGYLYDPTTGRRAVHPEQAAVVRRIFADVLAGRAVVAIARSLNAVGIPAFSGGIWYPWTLNRLMENETYTGRTIYRRTVAKQARDPRTGKKRRKIEERDAAEWIEIDGATPAIIDGDTFAAVRAILDNPERRTSRRRKHEYALSRRLYCSRCGQAMVGQTLRGGYRSYRCRAAFSGFKEYESCDGRFVHAGPLEDAVRREIAEALAQPGRVADEYDRHMGAGTDNAPDMAEIERQLARLDTQKARLVKLYTLGEVDDAYFEAEAAAIRTRREELTARTIYRPVRPSMPSMAQLEAACATLRAWIEQAGGDDMALFLFALQVRVSAEPGKCEISGALPTVKNNLNNFTHHCTNIGVTVPSCVIARHHQAVCRRWHTAPAPPEHQPGGRQASGPSRQRRLAESMPAVWRRLLLAGPWMASLGWRGADPAVAPTPRAVSGGRGSRSQSRRRPPRPWYTASPTALFAHQGERSAARHRLCLFQKAG